MATDQEISAAFAAVGRSLSAVLLSEARAATAVAEEQRDQALATLEAYRVGITDILMRLGMSKAHVDALLLEMEGKATLLEKPKAKWWDNDATD